MLCKNRLTVVDVDVFRSLLLCNVSAKGKCYKLVSVFVFYLMRRCNHVLCCVVLCCFVCVWRAHTFVYFYATTYIFFLFSSAYSHAHRHSAGSHCLHSFMDGVRYICTVVHCTSLTHTHTFLSFRFNRLYLLLRCSIPEYRSHSHDIFYCAPNSTVWNVHCKQNCT